MLCEMTSGSPNNKHNKSPHLPISHPPCDGLPVSDIFDLLITSTGSADAQLSPARHHRHTQGCIPTGMFDRYFFIKY